MVESVLKHVGNAGLGWFDSAIGSRSSILVTIPPHECISPKPRGWVAMLFDYNLVFSTVLSMWFVLSLTVYVLICFAMHCVSLFVFSAETRVLNEDEIWGTVSDDLTLTAHCRTQTGH